MNLNESIRVMKEKQDAFFEEAFKGYEVPSGIRQAAIRICMAYGIRGVCDPVYISNVIALCMGLGDGMSNFKKEA